MTGITEFFKPYLEEMKAYRQLPRERRIDIKHANMQRLGHAEGLKSAITAINNLPENGR